jgi:hypothetical protein
MEMTNNQRMMLYNRITALVGNIGGNEQQWKQINEDLTCYLKSRIESLCSLFLDELSTLHGRAYLLAMQKSWNKMSIFIRWAQTLFLKLDSYTNAYHGKTLVNIALGF